jgi:hypothetical protein
MTILLSLLVILLVTLIGIGVFRLQTGLEHHDAVKHFED